VVRRRTLFSIKLCAARCAAICVWGGEGVGRSFVAAGNSVFRGTSDAGVENRPELPDAASDCDG